MPFITASEGELSTRTRVYSMWNHCCGERCLHHVLDAANNVCIAAHSGTSLMGSFSHRCLGLVHSEKILILSLVSGTHHSTSLGEKFSSKSTDSLIPQKHFRCLNMFYGVRL